MLHNLGLKLVWKKTMKEELEVEQDPGNEYKSA